jgi:hypothetical protein
VIKKLKALTKTITNMSSEYTVCFFAHASGYGIRSPILGGDLSSFLV